jgi:hypothetical protein
MARSEDEAILCDLLPDPSTMMPGMGPRVFEWSGWDSLRSRRSRLLKMRDVYSVAALARVICQNDELRARFKMRGKEESVREILARAKGVKENGAFIVPRPKV